MTAVTKKRTRRWTPRAEAHVGDYVKPDGWNIGGALLSGAPAVDEDFAGSAHRLEGGLHAYPVNITITGRRPGRRGEFRCRVEFVRDGEPSVFSGGHIVQFDEVAV